jgi:hypothetical protein
MKYGIIEKNNKKILYIYFLLYLLLNTFIELNTVDDYL